MITLSTDIFSSVALLKNELQSDHHGTVRISSSPTSPQMQQLTIRTRTAQYPLHCTGVLRSVTGGHFRGMTILKDFSQ